MDRLLLGVSDDNMREKMMATHDLSLTKATAICKAVENGTVHVKAMKNEEVVHKVKKKKTNSSSKRYRTQPNGPTPQENATTGKASKRCKFCCQIHPMNNFYAQPGGVTAMHVV